jgi:CobQ-like glutamine amidotransferase family enzyme
MTAQLTIANLYPLCTTAQGDEGNARALRHRAALRGVSASIITTYAGALPRADIYLLGGLWHPEQPRLVELLGGPDGLRNPVRDGAVVLGINAGYQVLGEWFDTPDGTRHAGIGLLGVRTTSAPLVEGPVGTVPNAALGLPAMSGYESHQARTELDDDVEPLARLEFGVGNGVSPARVGDGAAAHSGGTARGTSRSGRTNSGAALRPITNAPDMAAVRRARAAANAHKMAHGADPRPVHGNAPHGGSAQGAGRFPVAPRANASMPTGGHGIGPHPVSPYGNGHPGHSHSGGVASTDGARSGRVIGTYLHGPVLARNADLADLLLSWALGRPMEPVDPGHVERVRAASLESLSRSTAAR